MGRYFIKKIYAVVLSIFIFIQACVAAYNYTDLTKGISIISTEKSYKEISANKRIQNKLKYSQNVLDDSDKDVIKKYVNGAVRGENTFLLINLYLKNDLSSFLSKKDITLPLKHRLKYYSDSLVYVLSKCRLPQNIILYRNIDRRYLNLLFKDQTIRQILSEKPNDKNIVILKEKLNNFKYQENGFTLVSYDKSLVKNSNCILKIYAPKNLQAVLADNLVYGKNKYILINRGYKWKITDIKTENDEKNGNYYMISVKLLVSD